MATVRQLLTRLDNGNLLTILEKRDLFSQVFTPYQVNGVTVGYTDTVTGRILLIPRDETITIDHALSLLPVGWVWESEPNAQGTAWRARAADTPAALAAASFTKFISSEPWAIALAIFKARTGE